MSGACSCSFAQCSDSAHEHLLDSLSMLFCWCVMSYVSSLCRCACATQSDSTLQTSDTYPPITLITTEMLPTHEQTPPQNWPMCFVAQVCFDVPLFALRQYSACTLLCVLTFCGPFCHSNMAQTPFSCPIVAFKNSNKSGKSTLTMMHAVSNGVTNASAREKITYSMNTCNVVLTSPTGTSSLSTPDDWCHVLCQWFRQKQGLRYLRRKTLCHLMYCSVFCASGQFVILVSISLYCFSRLVMFVPFKCNCPLSYQSGRKWVYFTSIHCNVVSAICMR